VEQNPDHDRPHGAVEVDELTPEAKQDLSELYRRWRNE